VLAAVAALQMLLPRRADRDPVMEAQIAEQPLAPPSRLLAVEARLPLLVLENPPMPTV
jgi:hypothetical protein